MGKNTISHSGARFDLPYADTAELKANQSVRATFKLSEKTILALYIASNQLGVQQKSLFDHLIADTEALKSIARNLKNSNGKNSTGRQKTFVISRKTLSTLQKIAKDYKASRDALVELSIQRLKPVIEQEIDKLESRKKIAAKAKHALVMQKRLLDEAKEQLGVEDPIYEHLAHAMDRFESACRSIAVFVEKSEKTLNSSVN